MLDLHESAWTRAKRDAGGVYRSAVFGLALSLVAVIAGATTVLVTDDPDASTAAKLAAPILVGAAAMALTILAVLVFEMLAAPLRQRNDLRRDWPEGPTEKVVNVPLELANFARRAEDLAHKILEQHHYLEPGDQATGDALGEEVFRFLSEHAPEHADRFNEAGRENSALIGKLNSRAEELRKIAAEVGS